MTRVRSLSRLSDRDLVAELERLLAKGRRLDAELLRFIAEVDRRRLYREHACSSMFAFCTERLGMSEDVAFRRIRVARVAREVPGLLDHLAAGRVHLSGLALLAPHLTSENAAAVLARAVGKSKREVEKIVREIAPLPDVATSIRKVPARRPLGAPAGDPLGTRLPLGSEADRSAAHRAAPAPGREQSLELATLPALPKAAPAAAPNALPSAACAKPAEVRPLSPARYHVSFTASEALKEHIDRARELAGHAATVESLFEEAMALLVAKLEQKRLGVRGRATPRADGDPATLRADGNPATPRADGDRGRSDSASAEAKSRYIPKSIRREVYERDGGRCTYVDGDGHRCSERRGLQFDHIRSHALGGVISVDNLRLRCGPHNRLYAERCFGPLFVAQQIAAPSKPFGPARTAKST